MLAIQDEPLTEPDILAEDLIIHFAFFELIGFLPLFNDSDQATLNHEIHFFDLTGGQFFPIDTAASRHDSMLFFYYFIIQRFVFFIQIV